MENESAETQCFDTRGKISETVVKERKAVIYALSLMDGRRECDGVVLRGSANDGGERRWVGAYCMACMTLLLSTRVVVSHSSSCKARCRDSDSDIACDGFPLVFEPIMLGSDSHGHARAKQPAALTGRTCKPN